MYRILFLLITICGFAAEPKQNTFATDLYGVLKKESGNLVFSPFNLYSSLSMVYAGAAGQTALEMRRVLHISGQDKSFFQEIGEFNRSLIAVHKEGYKLHVANGLFLNEGKKILKPFEKIAHSDFGAKIEEVDFSSPETASKLINRWISTQTYGKISSLLQSGDLDKMTRLVLTSAIYFEGAWVKPFDAKRTKKASFNAPQGPLEVEMMEQTSSFPYFEDDLSQGIWMQFSGAQTSDVSPALLLILPKEQDKIDALLSGENLASWLVQGTNRPIALKLPKFRLSNRFLLNDSLKALGMNEAFSLSADFSGIDGMRDLSLSKVIHQTYFDLDEKGVTAAAATASSIGVTSILPKEPPLPLVFDRPFLFLLVDQTSNTVLFIGKVEKP